MIISGLCFKVKLPQTHTLSSPSDTSVSTLVVCKAIMNLWTTRDHQCWEPGGLNFLFHFKQQSLLLTYIPSGNTQDVSRLRINKDESVAWEKPDKWKDCTWPSASQPHFKVQHAKPGSQSNAFLKTSPGLRRHHAPSWWSQLKATVP